MVLHLVLASLAEIVPCCAAQLPLDDWPALLQIASAELGLDSEAWS